MTTHDDRVYLEHILECAALLQDYTGNGKAVFMESVLVQDAVLRRLQTMAESTQRLSDRLKAQAPDVDWRALSGFRNVLVHDYLGGIDLERVWDAVEF
ncbi:HepT-like ribonuclease domain-containing protein [Trichothermofontia sp.]